MKRVTSSSEERKAELQAELDFQKARFLVASRRGMKALKNDLSIKNWVQTYPKYSVILAVIGGIAGARLVRPRNQKEVA